MNSLDPGVATAPRPSPGSVDRHPTTATTADRAGLRPLIIFASIALPTGWVMLTLPLAFDLPGAPFLLATNFLGLLAPALLLTARGPEGRAAVRRLLADAVKLPHPAYRLLAALAIPVVTWLVAALLGAASPLSGTVLAGFTIELLTSALIINTWEEVAWTGFVQRRATARWGAIRGSTATAGLFAGIHLPLAFYDAQTVQDVLLGVGMLAVTGIGLRLLIAGLDSWTGRSLLAVGLLHSAFNATRGLVAADHDWVRLGVTLALGLLVALIVARAQHATRSGDAPRPRDQRGRGRTAAVRALAAVGLLTFCFMLVLVVLDTVGRIGAVAVLEPAGSVEAQLGADHPGEAVHLAGTLAALAIGASGLLGLVVRPRHSGFAGQAGGAALGSIAVALVMGDPDNYGGQAGPVDLAFLVTAIPVLAAAATAVPWREWRRGGIARPRLLVLAGLALPAAVFGVQQALVQRRTWPPLADPHHQSHWYAMALLGLMVVPVVAGAALSGRGWRVATTTVGLAATAVAVTSLVAPTAGSALHPGWAAAAMVWGLALLTTTWSARRPRPHALPG